MPCELEALAISVSVKHFSHKIIQSSKRARILTDSRPCVLAYKKLLRGQFSASPKVTTYLSIAAQYSVEILHISGDTNEFSDFASRNPITCTSPSCSICEYINEVSTASIGEITVTDVISGKSKLPFTTSSSWLSAQQSCPDLRKVHKYLSTNATVPKKKKNFTDVKRYISCGAKVLKNNLIVVKQSTAFKPDVSRIVIPRNISSGLLTALHITLDHPSANQLKLAFSREFFTLDMDAIVTKITEQCYICASLKLIPSSFHLQTTSIPDNIIGAKFSADVKR